MGYTEQEVIEFRSNPREYCQHCLDERLEKGLAPMDSYQHYDRYGNFCMYGCDACFKKKFKQDWVFDSADAGESLEPED